MPSRVRVVYLSQNEQRTARGGVLRGESAKPIVKFYGKAAIRAAEEDLKSNWGDGAVVAEVLGQRAYKSATIWEKFSRIRAGGMLIGRVYIGREQRRLKPSQSHFVRVLISWGQAKPVKKKLAMGAILDQAQREFRRRAEEEIPYHAVRLGEGYREGYPEPPREIPYREPAAAPAQVGIQRIGIWG